MSWVTIENHDDYEICTEYPYQIRKKVNSRILKEHIDTNGYVIVTLNQYAYKKHVIIAEQFIANDDPNNKVQVDHINHIRSDNRIENLRWVTRSDNQRNRTSVHSIDYEFLDTIPDDAIEVDTYGDHTFEFYYYSPSDDEFYYYNGHAYRKLHVNIMKNTTSEYVYMIDTNNKNIKVAINKFKKLYGIAF